MSKGFIKIPRSLLENPLWIDSPPAQKEVFLVVLQNACFKPQKFDDHGKIIDLLPGQFCASIREIEKLCGKWITKKIIEGSILKFEKCHFWVQDRGHRKTILTFTHPDICEYFKTEEGTSLGTSGGQAGDKRGTESKKVKKEENGKKERDMSDSVEFGLALSFFDLVEKIIPNLKKPNLHSWSKSFDLLQRIDKRSLEDIRHYIAFVTSEGSWWRGKILSPDKLRKHWDTLTSQMKELEKKPSHEVNKVFSEDISKKFFSKYCELKVNGNEVVFIPTQGEQGPFSLKYSESGFKDQMVNLLKKRRFVKSESAL